MFNHHFNQATSNVFQAWEEQWKETGQKMQQAWEKGSKDIHDYMQNQQKLLSGLTQKWQSLHQESAQHATSLVREKGDISKVRRTEDLAEMSNAIWHGFSELNQRYWQLAFEMLTSWQQESFASHFAQQEKNAEAVKAEVFSEKATEKSKK